MYVRTVLLLIVLMASTVYFALIPFPDVNLGLTILPGTMINNIIAMGIATAKATLVLNFFMGTKFATRLTKMWAFAGFFGFSLMFLVYGDYSTRKYEPTPRWSADPGTSLSRSVHEARGQKEELKEFPESGRF